MTARLANGKWTVVDGAHHWNVSKLDSPCPCIVDENLSLIAPRGALGVKVLSAINIASYARDTESVA